MILPGILERLVSIIILQMQSGERQLWQRPSALHGVFMSNRCEFVGAAIFLALARAVARSGQILFIPTIIRMLFGPNASAATRFPFPSKVITNFLLLPKLSAEI